MSHGLEFRNGSYSFAFIGDVSEIWHSLGQQLPIGVSKEKFKEAAGFTFKVRKVPAYACIETGHYKNADWIFLVREDNGYIYCPAKPTYQLDGVQPDDIFENMWERCELSDGMLRMDRAGVLGHGEILWSQASYRDNLTVAGETIIPRLLSSTSYDLSQATTDQLTTEAVVCKNTLAGAHSDTSAQIKTRHRTKYNKDKVMDQVVKLGQNIGRFKRLGDELARQQMSIDTVGKFFAKLLEANLDKPKEISSRKSNQLAALAQAYDISKRERNTNEDNAWLALQAVTRYCDHVRGTRGGDNEDVARFQSSTFGSGNALKGEAMALLLPMIDKAKVYA